MIKKGITGEVADCLKAKGDDDKLDKIIAKHLKVSLPEGRDAVDSWKEYHYEDLQRWAAPCITCMIDAQAKIHSGDPALEAEGQKELKQFYDDWLKNKVRFSRCKKLGS